MENDGGFRVSDQIAEAPRHEYGLKRLDLKLPCVCGTCNSQWMQREVEAPARPLIEAMFEGKWVALPPEAQTKVASWAALMVIVWCSMTGAVVFPEAQRTAFYRTHLPLPSMHVWLVRREGGPTRLHADNYVITRQQEGNQPGSPHGTVSTFGADYLGFQVLWLDPSVAKRAQVEIPSLWRDFVVPIWPVVGRQFWPPIGVDDDGQAVTLGFDRWMFDLFAHRFADPRLGGVRLP